MIGFISKLAVKIGRAHDPAARKRRSLQQIVAQNSPLRVILGAGPTQHRGWISTDIDSLNLAKAEEWTAIFRSRRIDILMAEHVWEHLSPDEARTASRNCFHFLKAGGR